MYADEWGGLPSRVFLRGLDADLPRFVDQFAGPALCADQRAGELTLEMANAVGLPAGIPVAVGALDAHLGAVGAGVRPGTLVKILGTSSCDITVWPANRRLGDIEGLCGIVPGSVLPGSHGLEAGQSAVGDIFHWFAHHFGGERDAEAAHRRLTAQAKAVAPGQSGLCALDWNNGNRSVLVDPLLTGLLVGQTLHTTAAEVYRALLEATAFGARAIVDRFEEHGVRIRAIIACGGIAERNPLALQILADVLDRPLGLARSAQSCALGAAICGAVVGGAFRSIPAAQARLTGTQSTVFRPRRAAVAVYEELFEVYRRLHDAFGTQRRDIDLHGVMKRLIAVRNRERRGTS